MSSESVLHPSEIPECPPPGIRATAAGARSTAMAMAGAAATMQSHSAPAGWEGPESELAGHVMTRTARSLDAATDALQHGVAALDTFCDAVDRLRPEHRELKTKHQELSEAADTLSARVAEDGDDLDAKVHEHNTAVTTLNSGLRRWAEQLEDAETTLASTLKKIDTMSEARALAGSSPDVYALRKQAAEAADKSPHAVRRWWEDLSPLEREMMKTSFPELIGAMNGIPIIDRHETNWARMKQLKTELLDAEKNGSLTSDEKRELENLRGVEKGIAKRPSRLSAFLMLFEPSAEGHDGRAAVAFGNPETAEHVTVNVPGVLNDMAGFDSIAGTAVRIQGLTERHSGESVASIAWLGYDAPSGDDLQNMLRETEAAKGASRLVDFVDGLRATRAGDAGSAHTTVMGHSYGSTTVAKAGSEGMQVDDLVLLGSPGAGEGNTHVTDLNARNVYVGSSDDDPVTRLGNRGSVGLGNDPAHMDFGGKRFHVGSSGGDFDSGLLGWKRGLDNHVAYYEEDSPWLRDIVKIAAGDGNRVQEVAARETYSNYGWWLKELL